MLCSHHKKAKWKVAVRPYRGSTTTRLQQRLTEMG